MLGYRAQLLLGLLYFVLPASAEGKPYYAIPVAIFILVAILLVICVTLWVVPYCVDHQRKRKRQTDAAKSTNQIYDDDDDEISTAYKDKAAEAAADEGKSNPFISRPVNYAAPPQEAVDSAPPTQNNSVTPYFFPVNPPMPAPSPVYPRTDQYGVPAQGTPGEETEL